MKKPQNSYVKKPVSILSNDQLLLFDCLKLNDNSSKLDYSVICKSFKGTLYKINAKALMALCLVEPELKKIIDQISKEERSKIYMKVENMQTNEKYSNNMHSKSMFPVESRPKMKIKKIQNISKGLIFTYRYVLSYRETSGFNNGKGKF